MGRTISLSLRQQVFKRDNYTCRYCGTTTGPFHADHVHPVSRGGETTLENLVTACSNCNLRKSDRVGVRPKAVGHFDRPMELRNLLIGLVAMLAVLLVMMALPTQSQVSLLCITVPMVVVVGGILLKQRRRWR